MSEIVKDMNGNKLKEPEELYVVETSDGVMTEVANMREAVAVIAGSTYVDCETAETEWHMRVDAAKKIGLSILATEDDATTTVYDERIGKIAYSYTDPNPEYDIPDSPELIRVENDETFMYTLAKIRFLRLWKRIDGDYKDVLEVLDVDSAIGEELEKFRDKGQNIPLHHKIDK